MLITADPLQVDCMRQALGYARLCTPISTAFCVGCVITPINSSKILSTGHSRELEGNTHAEECALKKLDVENLRGELDLYTTLEPCSVRLSGKRPCSQLIIDFNDRMKKSNLERISIKNVYLGVSEPNDFVDCKGVEQLIQNGINVIQVTGFETQCLNVARGSQETC
ncbi:hypothetical protein O181_049469 [Austropuccinia psidii MF-1]|uniref:CMP/dCMP-type deaminase domain-containing protein n=1 Tax=Austropuccinia psidii MF-1 TaxID=1389203 RepID=A0A9Q3HNT4_9BASI|nr:hypothetical protein [Austropuccinia psidii MF-1]